MKKVTLVTGHYLASKRKAGFHNLADAYKNLGYEVLFFTAPISYMLQLKGDYKFQFPVKQEKGKLIKKQDHLYSYVHFTPWHVANLRYKFLNAFFTPLFKQYKRFRFKEAEAFVAESDLIIFESTPGLFLFERFKELNNKAHYVYRVSDDLRLLKVSPLLIKKEKEIFDSFDLVSVPSVYIYEVLKHYGHKNLKLNFHGVNKDLYDQKLVSPYNEAEKNLIFVGNSHFDHNFVEVASKLKPTWKFHIIGPIDRLPKRENIIIYGEMAFEKTLPYVKFADVGLQIRHYAPGAESLTDSLKMLQYTYCQLPIIAPSFLKSNRKNVFYYDSNDEQSIHKALDDAISYEQKDLGREIAQILSWEEIAARLEDKNGHLNMAIDYR